METNYITPDQVCELVPGMTKSNLAMRRYQGLPPAFYKPSPRVVLYDRESVEAWVRDSMRTSTAEVTA